MNLKYANDSTPQPSFELMIADAMDILGVVQHAGGCGLSPTFLNRDMSRYLAPDPTRPGQNATIRSTSVFAQEGRESLDIYCRFVFCFIISGDLRYVFNYYCIAHFLSSFVSYSVNTQWDG